MPTLSQGSSVDLNVSVDSTLTIQNPGGFAIVENPAGTRVWAGGQADRKIDVKSGIARITATTGPLFYELAADPTFGTSVIVDPNTGLPYSGSSIVTTQRTRPLRCATFGPSHADLNPTNTDITLFVGAMGSSTGSNISPERWQVNTFYPLAYLVANGGIGGQTTAQMLARSSNASSASRKSIQDVIDLRPEVVFLCSLDTNDFASLTSGNYRTTVDTAIANHRQIVQHFLSAGVYVVDEGNYPYSGSAHTNPALTRQAIIETNAIYAADAAAYPGRMEYLNAASVLGDSTANYIANATQNDANVGLHKSLYGEWLLAQTKASALTRRFGPSRSYRYAGTNLLKNATLGTAGANSLIERTTTGTGGGLRALGWTHGANGNLTQNLNSIQIIDGKRYSMMLGTSTAANAQQAIYFPLDAANFTLVSGDIIGLEFDLYISDATDGPPPTMKNVDARFNLVNNVPQTLSNTHFQNASGLTARSFPSAYKAHVVCQPIQLPAPGTLTTAEFWFEWITDELVQWKIGAANPRLVKIGSSGVLDAEQVA